MKKRLLSVEGAAFGYGARPVIEEVSLSIQEGDFAAVTGPNGSGKTTLFKGILGLIPPLRGSVSRDPGLKGRIGYVPQRDTLDAIYPLTALETVRMGVDAARPWYQGWGSAANAAALRCLERVGMERQARHLFAELSGGQRQRVLIARALSIGPGMLVLDEPTAGIDHETERRILEALRDLQRSGLTILMVSHHIRALEGAASRMIRVRNGRVTEGGLS